MAYIFLPENISQEYAVDGFATGLLIEATEESLNALKGHLCAIKKYFSEMPSSLVDVPPSIDAAPRLGMGVLNARAVNIHDFSPSDTICIVKEIEGREPGTYLLDEYPQNCVGIEDGTADREYDLAEPPNETILTKDGFESAFRWDDQDICVVSRKYDTMIMVCEQVLEELATQSPRP